MTVTDDYGTSTQSYSMFIEYEENMAPLDVIEDFEVGITDFGHSTTQIIHMDGHLFLQKMVLIVSLQIVYLLIITP